MRISDWSSDVCSADLSRQGVRHRTIETPAAYTRIRPPQSLTPQAPGCRLTHTARPRACAIGRGILWWETGHARAPEIGRASCRARVCQYVSIPVVAVSLKKNNIDNTHNLLHTH